MKPNPIYIVTFEIHRNCQIQQWVYYCEAQNAKDACEIAKATWSLKSHMFHIHAVKSTKQDTKALCVRAWTGIEYKWLDVMGWHIMVDFKTWRINGRNVYA